MTATPHEDEREIANDAVAEAPRAAYEHPLPVRMCHWVNSIALLVMIGSGLQIFRAFPSFGAKIPQHNLLNVPRALTLGGWLGGALQWHITFAWIYVATGTIYLAYQLFSGNYRQLQIGKADIAGIWPMVRHYFFFGKKPRPTEAYNPLQKLAYVSVLLLGIASVLTGMVLYNPVQFSALAWFLGGYSTWRVCGTSSCCARFCRFSRGIW